MNKQQLNLAMLLGFLLLLSVRAAVTESAARVGASSSSSSALTRAVECLLGTQGPTERESCHPYNWEHWILPRTCTQVCPSVCFHSLHHCPANSVGFCCSLDVPSHTKVPSAFVIGVMKGGTTSLFHYLHSHPNILRSSGRSEVHYFDRFLHHDVRTSYFAKWPDPTLEFKHKVALDVTPAYIFYYSVPTYMKVVAPEGRFILILREPVSRAISNYVMNKYRKTKRFPSLPTFDVEVDKGIRYLQKCGLQTSADWRRCWQMDSLEMKNIVPRGIYVFQLQRWLEEFSLKQFFIVTTHDLFADPRGMLHRIETFLRIPHHNFSEELLEKHYNTAPKKSVNDSFASNTLQRLRKFYAPFNDQLEDVLGRKLNWN